MLAFLLIGLTAASLTSYGGAVLYRYRHNMALIRPRSFCDHCHSPLPGRALIPIVGPLLVLLRCPACNKRTPLLYSLSEFLGALTALIPFYLGVPAPLIAFYWIFIGAALLITLSDLSFGLVPLAIVLPTGAAGILFSFFGIGPAPLHAILGGVGGWAFFFLIRIVSRGGCGLGDADYAALLGLFLGWRILLAVLVTALLISGLWAGYMLLSGRAGRKSRAAFAPFLSAATLIVSLTGNWVFMLYGWPV